jgi:4-amino-4-deoxy-L-arabinose transferase-like glycosyltransferase
MFRHKQPFWYFIPVLMAGLLPWLIFATASFVRAVSEYRTSSFHLFFGLWAALPVIFFSFSQSKLPGYILPAIPPFAILLGDYLWRRLEEGQEPPLCMTALHALTVGALFGASLLTVYFVLGLKPVGTALVIAILAGVIAFVGVLGVIYAKGLCTTAVVTLVPTLLAFAFVLKFASPSIDHRNSARPIAEQLENMPSKKELKVAVFGVPRDIEYGLNFYENTPIPNYDRGEIPAGPHLLVAKAGSEQNLRLMLGNRITQVGEFPSRKIEFYAVSAK